MQRSEYAQREAATFAAQWPTTTVPCSTQQRRPAPVQVSQTLHQPVVVSFVFYALISSLLILMCPAMMSVKAIAGSTTKLDSVRRRHWEDRESTAA